MQALGIVQARLGSSRLPGKVLSMLGGRSVLERVLSCARSYCDDVVVATSSDPADAAVVAECERLRTRWVRGPLHDVFSRYRLALEQPEAQGFEWFFRITADCPLQSRALGQALLTQRHASIDYLYFADDELPRGVAPELVRRGAFDRVDETTLSAEEREHVTLAFYRTGSRFCAKRLPVPPEWSHPELRLTLDFPEDKALLDELFTSEPDLTAEQAVRRLLAAPELRVLNQHRVTEVPALARKGVA